MTGAGGKTGKLIAKKVHASPDFQLRALVRTEEVRCMPFHDIRHHSRNFGFGHRIISILRIIASTVKFPTHSVNLDLSFGPERTVGPFSVRDAEYLQSSMATSASSLMSTDLRTGNYKISLIMNHHNINFSSQLVDDIKTKIRDARYYLQELNRFFKFPFAPKSDRLEP